MRAKIKDEDLAELDLSSWEVAFNGAENVRASTVTAFETRFGPCGFRRRASFPCYGLAEGTLLATSSGVLQGALIRHFDTEQLAHNVAVPVERASTETGDTEHSRALVSSGRALPGEEPVIIDPDTGEKLPEGRVGEIYVIGGSVAEGYWQRPDATEATFNHQHNGTPRRVRSGDLGFISNGELYVTGRLKDLIIVNGVNHHPSDIETTVCNLHSGFRPDGSAAFSIVIDGTERVAVAQEIERRALRELDIDKLLSQIRTSLWDDHRLMQPVIILTFGGSLPRTSSGKIKRHACHHLLTPLVERLRNGEPTDDLPIANRLITVEVAGTTLNSTQEKEAVSA
ncbi:hypothetical protein CAL65_11780 [Alkalilimnicola ehrlichii]|uniref:Uncharacterized protein n=1 Tax=Alkalilimnicola ehrlichii TaxID=351052 RepID=A0A3E0WW21_9GAMM|nr:hypothetical protein CAL65_11780 [Alkalilimnicola ehrlichii]